MTVAEAQLETYLAHLVDAIEGVVPVADAFVVGSALVGGFDPATSDLDVVVVVERPLEEKEREAVVSELHELPQPFRKLELVVYAAGAKPPAYELNYPDGPGEPAFWFVLDAALAQRFAAREWGELLQPVSETETRGAAEELLGWAEAHDEPVHAARARHYLEHGEWITKEEARR
jgi:predicted nucleotidyltransferase